MLEINKLNNAQRKAVTWGEGPLLVLAGPGSGKTFVIVSRILYLLEKGIPPESILVITFTKEAAMSMQHRFQNSTPNITQPVNFGTFHSVFYHILKESYPNRRWNLIKETQKKNLMSSILRGMLTKDEYEERIGEIAEDTESVLRAIMLYKNTGHLQRSLKYVPSAWKERFEAIAEKYKYEMKRSELLEFDDMIYECHELLLRDENIRNYWKKRFRHILIDEFQDCNQMQYETLKLLSGENTNLFAVGDDDQSIYGFRGASPDIIRRFSEDFHSGRVLLDTNYRSREEIVMASLAVINENRNRFPKELRAVKTDRERIEIGIKSFETKEQEQDYVQKLLREWSEIHQKEEKVCAVLFRTNAYMQRMASELTKAGISFGMKEKIQSIYENPIIRDIMAYLLLSCGEWKREYILRIMNKPMRYINREAIDERGSIKEIVDWYGRNALAGVRNEQITSLELLDRQLTFLKTLSPANGVNYVLRGIGYGDYLRRRAAGNQEKYNEWMELTEWLKADGEKYQSIKEWHQAQESYTRKIEDTDSAGARRGRNKENIQLMTVHASKGLEFEKVIVPDCNEKIFPHGNLPDEESVEEERRIFYVAMTRAKEDLELLYLKGDKARPRLPSRFLNPLILRRQ